MKLMLLTTMFIVSITYFLGSPVKQKPGGVAIKSENVVQDTASLAGEWQLVPALPSDSATGKLPFIRFNLGQRQFNGFTGCNQMSGTFTVKSDQLQFDKNIALTKIACAGYNEKDFLANLLRVNHYKIKEGILWMMIDQTPVASWRRSPGIKKVL